MSIFVSTIRFLIILGLFFTLLGLAYKYTSDHSTKSVELACLDGQIYAVLFDSEHKQIGMVKVEDSTCGKRPRLNL